MTKHEKTSIKEKLVGGTVAYAGAAAASGVGEMVGAAIGGPGGAVVGAIVGTAIEKVFHHTGKEITERMLSPAENRKVETAYTVAQTAIAQKLEAGKTLRDDGFFEEDENGRSDAEEILEGTLFAAQREFEEKKIKLLGTMYANLAFDETVSKPIANYLIKLAERMTYRQILILQSVGIAQQTKPCMPLKQTAYREIQGIENVAIATELFELYRMGILHSSAAILDCAGINPAALSVGGYGAHLFNLMELDRNMWQDSDDIFVQGEVFAFLLGTQLHVETSSTEKAGIYCKCSTPHDQL